MQIASSAKRTCRAPASTSECTATVATPSSRQARITRMAISPRFAIRTLRNMAERPALDHACRSGLSDLEQALAEFHARAVLHEDFDDRARKLRLDFVHELHGLDDAKRLSLLEYGADLGEGLAVRTG